MMACSGSERGHRVGQADRGQRPRLRLGRATRPARTGSVSGARPGRPAPRARSRRPGRGRPGRYRAAVRHQVAGAARVGEERHRRAGPGQDQVADPGQLSLGLLGQVGQPVDGRAPRRPLHPRRERLGQQPRPGRGADPAGRPQPALGQRVTAQQEESGLPSARSWRRRILGCRRRSQLGRRAGRSQRAALAPGHVGGQHQGGDLAAAGRRQRPHGVRGQVAGGARGVDPARHGAGQGLDVGLQRRVVADVAGGVAAHDDQHRTPGPARVVQVGQAVGQAGPQVQQHRGGPSGDAGVAVGGAGRHALEQGQHAAHLRHRVQGGRRSASPTCPGS